jgi:hypothetical protein
MDRGNLRPRIVLVVRATLLLKEQVDLLVSIGISACSHQPLPFGFGFIHIELPLGRKQNLGIACLSEGLFHAWSGVVLGCQTLELGSLDQIVVLLCLLVNQHVGAQRQLLHSSRQLCSLRLSSISGLIY